MPRMPVSGVRISWVMLARKALLVRLAASASSFLRLIWNVAPPIPTMPMIPMIPNASPVVRLRSVAAAKRGSAEMDTLMPPSTSPTFLS